MEQGKSTKPLSKSKKKTSGKTQADPDLTAVPDDSTEVNHLPPFQATKIITDTLTWGSLKGHEIADKIDTLYLNSQDRELETELLQNSHMR